MVRVDFLVPFHPDTLTYFLTVRVDFLVPWTGYLDLSFDGGCGRPHGFFTPGNLDLCSGSHGRLFNSL